MRYTYFVSYSTNSGNFGNFDIDRDKKIRSIDDIRNIEIAVKEKIQQDIIIHNYQLLRKSWKK